MDPPGTAGAVYDVTLDVLPSNRVLLVPRVRRVLSWHHGCFLAIIADFTCFLLMYASWSGGTDRDLGRDYGATVPVSDSRRRAYERLPWLAGIMIYESVFTCRGCDVVPRQPFPQEVGAAAELGSDRRMHARISCADDSRYRLKETYNLAGSWDFAGSGASVPPLW